MPHDSSSLGSWLDRRLSRRSALAALASGAAAGLLAACQQPAAPPSPTAAPKPAATTAPAPAATTAPALAATPAPAATKAPAAVGPAKDVKIYWHPGHYYECYKAVFAQA